MTLVSYCCECDALPGECEHRGFRYLDPIVYETVPAGCKVPDGDERERWDNPPAVALGENIPKSDGQVWELQRVVVELEQWIYLDPALEGLVRERYEDDPRRVTRLAENVIEKARTGKLSNPGGLLVKRLRELA